MLSLQKSIDTSRPDTGDLKAKSDAESNSVSESPFRHIPSTNDEHFLAKIDMIAQKSHPVQLEYMGYPLPRRDDLEDFSKYSNSYFKDKDKHRHKKELTNVNYSDATSNQIIDSKSQRYQNDDFSRSRLKSNF